MSFSMSQSIPKRMIIPELPSEYSQTPGGTIYGTTPGGKFQIIFF